MAFRAAKDNMIKKAHNRAAIREIMAELDQLEHKWSKRLTGEKRETFVDALVKVKAFLALGDIEG